MNYSVSHIILKVTKDFIIDGIMENPFSDLSIEIGDPLLKIISSESHSTFFDLQSKVSSKSTNSNWKLRLTNHLEVLFNIIEMESDYTVFLINVDANIATLFESMAKINNDLINQLREYQKKLMSSEENTKLVEEVMKLNSELVNTRRELSYKNKQFELINYVDELTQINNRRKFFIDIYDLVNEDDYLLVMMDINNFKIINDKFGHVKGDEVLVFLADKLKSCVNKYNGFVYRLGGDEFAALIKNTSTVDFDEIAHSIENQLKTIHPDIGIAYGITTVTKENCNHHFKAEYSMGIADTQMFKMKKTKKKVSYR